MKCELSTPLISNQLMEQAMIMPVVQVIFSALSQAMIRPVVQVIFSVLSLVTGRASSL